MPSDLLRHLPCEFVEKIICAVLIQPEGGSPVIRSTLRCCSEERAAVWRGNQRRHGIGPVRRREKGMQIRYRVLGNVVFKDGSEAVGSARVSRSIQVSVSALDQRGLGSDPSVFSLFAPRAVKE